MILPKRIRITSAEKFIGWHIGGTTNEKFILLLVKFIERYIGGTINEKFM